MNVSKAVLTLLLSVIIAKENKNKKNESIVEERAPILILTPHSSMFDLIAANLFNHLTCVSQYQLVNNLILSKLVQLNNPILVKREDPSSRKDVMQEIIERSKTEQIFIYPEGTNGNRLFLLKFKSGAFKPGLPVQTLFIEYDISSKGELS
ncbi:1-acylglycerophosphocholine O-acyltransferase 1-like protein [Dinothrombium tinctorium]|uniref:1-acylglycerophosphocholine O-acyltransferase 1-like protein n=1 Tax=Dinothrombium tinctorium TaxID=1965070 RepID=A0A3S3PT64_9ACAR|nr:1-acylglycerophosphocholine O-acyltransferase 1-like protein [Dinothrombium tinctorium]